MENRNFRDLISEGERLSLDELADRAGETHTVINSDFKSEVLRAISSGDLIFTGDRKLMVRYESDHDPRNTGSRR